MVHVVEGLGKFVSCSKYFLKMLSHNHFEAEQNICSPCIIVYLDGIGNSLLCAR